ncbi:MFS transporter [Frankia sp. AgB1.9]|uniref:MFS transporter n=1 Tax=unclassified Frankia TaxID=2632575 RepID=UPI00193327A7|nr:MULTISPECIES: MFS transporter [unclassified Frankia]MBL7494040.1 MFS transporter [Frankia sp. AgW1.1]MBL7547520.1 MFS transporter [Frankia sp. AgB1.9]MBL7619030.1 MFS transporter [Frankia sp. AgB1.8]
MARAGKLRELLVVPGFRALYASRLTSQTADGIFQATLVSYVLFSPERATSPGALAAALAIVVLPFSVIGPFAGIVLDRVSRQRVLVYCSLVRAALLAILAVLIAAGHTGADFYVVALGAVSVNRFVLAALSAGLPMVVDLDRLVSADSLSVTSGTVAALVGGGIGTGVRGLTGGHDASVALVAGLAGLAYLGAAATAATLADRRMFGPVEAGDWAGSTEQLRRVAFDFADGARVLWRAGPARRALAALTASRAAYGLVLFMTILLYANYFKGGDGRLWGLAAVAVASGIGTVLAAVATPAVTARIPRARWILIVLVGGGVIEIAFGLPYSSVLFVLAGLPLGFSAQASKICVDTIVQEHIPDAYRGRAFSLYDLLFNVAFAGAGAVAALVVPKNGHSPGTIVAAGAGYLLAGVIYYLAARRHASDLRIHMDGAATGPGASEPAPPAAVVAGAPASPDVSVP